MAGFNLQALFLVCAALPPCRSSVSASASCVGSATSPNLRSNCLRRAFALPLRAQDSPVVDVDREG